MSLPADSHFRVRVAEYSEAEEISRVSGTAFDGQSFVKKIYPNGEKYPEEVLRSRIYVTRLRMLQDNYVVYVVEDTKEKKIAGYALWGKLNSDKPVNPHYGFLLRSERKLEALRQKAMNILFKNKAEDPAAYSSLVGGMADAKMQRLAGRPCWFLHILAVHSSYQRKGLGKALVKVGMELAEKDGFPTYLEASKEGMGLYSQLGWEVIAKVQMLPGINAPVMSWTPPGVEGLPRDEDVSLD